MHVLPIMKAQGSGCIINVASRAGTVTVPYSTGYSTSKAAVIRMTECIQKDLDTDGLGDKIQLYSCHPGAVQTDMSKGASKLDKVPVELTSLTVDFKVRSIR